MLTVVISWEGHGGRRYDVNLNDFYFIGDTSLFKNIFERYLRIFQNKMLLLKQKKERRKVVGKEGCTNQT